VFAGLLLVSGSSAGRFGRKKVQLELAVVALGLAHALPARHAEGEIRAADRGRKSRES